MPATAGRVRMPADNRLSVSDSLKSSEIWQKSVGYDPYAPGGKGIGGSSASAFTDIEEKAKGLFALARLTGSSSATTPGACRRCGEVGHLTYQCRNDISLVQLNGNKTNVKQCLLSRSDDSSTSTSSDDESSSTPTKHGSRAKSHHRGGHRKSKKKPDILKQRRRRHDTTSDSSLSDSSIDDRRYSRRNSKTKELHKRKRHSSSKHRKRLHVSKSPDILLHRDSKTLKLTKKETKDRYAPNCDSAEDNLANYRNLSSLNDKSCKMKEFDKKQESSRSRY